MVIQWILTTSLTKDTAGHPKCRDLATDSCLLLFMLSPSCQALVSANLKALWKIPVGGHCTGTVTFQFCVSSSRALLSCHGTHTDHD